ncbi:MAG: hypothetical protein HC892_09370 [Saprospiraceae bacterium]|nr:hypothetical protein [Saprospiraceae bacterium]
MGSLISCYALAQNWTTYRAPDNSFSISAPYQWSEKTDTISTDIGNLKYFTLYCQAPDTSANQIYMLSYCDYPDGTIHSDSTELITAFFEETMQSAAFSINGKLMYQADEALYNFPGKYWRIDYLQGNAVIKTRAFLVRNRYYAVQVVSKKVFHINPDSDRFLDGFRLN